jgi:Fe-S cluster biogenesis protein NfuA
VIPFSDEELCGAVKNFLPSTEEYIKSHQGTVKFLGIKDATAYIELGGTCNGCSMSTLTTKMVIQKRLRELIHPELNVESIFPDQTGSLPESLTEC